MAHPACNAYQVGFMFCLVPPPPSYRLPTADKATNRPYGVGLCCTLTWEMSLAGEGGGLNLQERWEHFQEFQEIDTLWVEKKCKYEVIFICTFFV